MEESGQCHFPAALPRCPLDRRLGRPQSRSGRGVEEKKSNHCPRRELNHGRPARSLVSILSELSRLLYVNGACLKYRVLKTNIQV
jgi:hypothetical protein